MFSFRRGDGDNSGSLRAVRALYRSFTGQNRPEVRARRLLREWLSPAQREQFDAEGYFDVIGCDTCRRYRIHWGSVSNVVELDEKMIPKIGWCFVPEQCLVAGDVMLAQKIALETNEGAALALANRFSPRPLSQPRVVRRAY
ncbi:hypothetical protein [Bradyrhizobium sp. McL0616]|uniref:hypothetical protein n=1 Tax=Bradyrhizobium sp. McL0616 TaxID=3415674 RepID=UPI003CF70C53